MMKADLTGKTALVTGGTGGIGSEICKVFAENGATVFVSGRNREKGEEVVQEILEAGGKAYFAQGDVSSLDDCKRILKQIEEVAGGIDILVNNAGGNIPLERRGKVYKYYDDAWNETIDMCMDGTYNFTHLALPYMKKNGGRVINVGSVTGFRMGLRNQCAYNICKAAIHNITRCSASELAPYGITVNCVIPGSTWHSKFKQKYNFKDPVMMEKFISHIPVGEGNSSEDMANAALYFATEPRVTGVLLNVDGGWAAGFCK